MLKKAGIVTAAAAAGLLMASPLAFAGQSHKGAGHHKGEGKHHESEGSEEEFNGINVLNDNNIAVPVQACGDQVAAVIGVIVPVLSPTNAQCNSTVGIMDN